MMSSEYETLRRFNRSWSARVGVLEDSFLGSGRPLGQARVLYEIGDSGVGVLGLRTRLGLDSGYLSRILRRLERDGLVEVHPDPADRRRRRVTLTAAGQVARADLEERSERLAARLVAPLGPGARARLDQALATAEQLIRAATVAFDFVDPTSAEAVDAVAQYVAELDRRFPAGFRPGAALAHDAESLRPPTGTFLVARSEEEVVACGGVQRLDEATGEIKRMWVADAWRGVGLGRRVLGELEEEVRRLGYRRVRLDTNGTLDEAIAMYRRAGYRSIERYNDNPYAQHWFEKDLG